MMMGTEIFLFGPKGAEKMEIKDFNLHTEIMSMNTFFGSDRSSRSHNVSPSVRSSSPSLSRTVILHLFSSDSLRTYQDDFRMTSGWLQGDFRVTSGWLQGDFRMISSGWLREHLKSTQRLLIEQESNETSSYRRSLKYFVLFTKCHTI